MSKYFGRLTKSDRNISKAKRVIKKSETKPHILLRFFYARQTIFSLLVPSKPVRRRCLESLGATRSYHFRNKYSKAMKTQH